MRPELVQSKPVALRQPSERLQQVSQLTIEAALLLIAYNTSTQYFEWEGHRYFYRKEELFVYFIQAHYRRKSLRDLSDPERVKALEEYSSRELALKHWWIHHTVGIEPDLVVFTRLQYNLGGDAEPHWLPPGSDEARLKKRDALGWLDDLGDMGRNPPLWEMVLRLNPGAAVELKRALASIVRGVNGWTGWRGDVPSGGWTVEDSGGIRFNPVLRPAKPKITSTVVELNLERVSESSGEGRAQKPGSALFRPKMLIFNHSWPKDEESPPGATLKAAQDLEDLLDDLVNFLKPVGEGVTVVLRGYADRSGTPAFNRKLSALRARWVQKRVAEALWGLKPGGVPTQYATGGCGDRFADPHQLKHEPSRVVVISMEPAKAR